MSTLGNVGTESEVHARLAAMPAYGGGGRLRQFMRNHGWNVGVVLELIAALFLWQLITDLQIMPESFLPPPASVWNDLVFLFENGSILEHTWFTLKNFLTGFVLACVVGIPVGIALGSSGLLELLFGPSMWAAYSVPRIALAPIFVLVFGMGPASKIVLVFLMAVFPITINTLQGVKAVPPSLVRVAWVYGASRWEVSRKVVAPSLLPYILAGLRIAVAAAIAGSLIGEFIGSFEGLGLLLARSAFNFEVSRALALVIIVVILAQGLMTTVNWVKKWAAPWDTSEWT